MQSVRQRPVVPGVPVVQVYDGVAGAGRNGLQHRSSGYPECAGGVGGRGGTQAVRAGWVSTMPGPLVVQVAKGAARSGAGGTPVVGTVGRPASPRVPVVPVVMVVWVVFRCGVGGWGTSRVVGGTGWGWSGAGWGWGGAGSSGGVGGAAGGRGSGSSTGAAGVPVLVGWWSWRYWVAQVGPVLLVAGGQDGTGGTGGGRVVPAGPVVWRQFPGGVGSRRGQPGWLVMVVRGGSCRAGRHGRVRGRSGATDGVPSGAGASVVTCGAGGVGVKGQAGGVGGV